MAIALHASSRPLVIEEADGSCQSGTFSPPAQSFLVAHCIAVDDTASGPTVSGGGLTWTKRVEWPIVENPTWGQLWTAPCPSGATNINVTLTSTGFTSFGLFASAMRIDVYTGVDLTTPVGASGENSTTTNNATVTVYNSTRAGSRGVLVGGEFTTTVTPTTTDDGVGFVAGSFFGITGLFARKAANTGSVGTAVTFNMDADGTAAADWQWVALEVLPAPDASGPVVNGWGPIPIL